MYTVIASVARQSHAMESMIWRLPRHFVPRNDDASGLTWTGSCPWCHQANYWQL